MMFISFFKYGCVDAVNVYVIFKECSFSKLPNSNALFDKIRKRLFGNVRSFERIEAFCT